MHWDNELWYLSLLCTGTMNCGTYRCYALGQWTVVLIAVLHLDSHVVLIAVLHWDSYLVIITGLHYDSHVVLISVLHWYLFLCCTGTAMWYLSLSCTRTMIWWWVSLYVSPEAPHYCPSCSFSNTLKLISKSSAVIVTVSYLIKVTKCIVTFQHMIMAWNTRPLYPCVWL